MKMIIWTVILALLPTMAKSDTPSAEKILQQFKAGHCTMILMNYRVVQRLGPRLYEIAATGPTLYEYEKRAILTTHSIDYKESGVLVESGGIGKKSRLETAMYAKRKGKKQVTMDDGFSRTAETLEESKT